MPLQRLNWALATQRSVEIWVRRDDLIDTHLSGNKFYKLYYNLRAAKAAGYKQLLSFGGAYSNHIYALAAAAKAYGFQAVGVIRGERPKYLSPTLQDAEAWGMKLHFVSRTDYRERSSPELRQKLTDIYGDFFEIPEGGANAYGVQGTKALGVAIHRQVKSDYTSVCLASGTANTLAGVAAGLQRAGDLAQKVIGFSVLKDAGDRGFQSLGAQVINYQKAINESTSNWCLINGFHGGGYGKKLPTNMRQFMTGFECETELQLDPVYTAKMCWGVAQLLAKDYWQSGSRLVLIHTGGLQGRRGFDL
ncbi:1-aminocyclopropane-1-carboxylate deaminase [Cellvibrio zantedeschiae]|uniref:1-aminocyclopropane-1-carboxylate deaminase n=1 Tax=Cellvibrio zantedeschiae TaxID=1237077 RepID=A0ABQ3AWF6_9GAMM|nr:1-aminocyclopropane-1-carboxylate deaminase [Cellvibrio zantedeschiae]